MNTIKFRDYQESTLDALDDHFIFEDEDSGMISIPTGGGKTVIFTQFLSDKKGLILSHTDELVTQAIEKFKFVTGKECGQATANVWDTEGKDVSSGSIQTIHARLDSPEVEELAKSIDYIVIDEAHHMGASTYKEVHERFLELNPKIKLLGVTATPYRTDNQLMTDLFSQIIYQVSIKDLIKDKHLVDTHGSVVKLPKFNLDEIEQRDGDFSSKSLSNRLKEDNTLEFIAEKYIEKSNGGKSIFFTPSVEVSKLIIEKLKSKGIKAAHIDGSQKKQERADLIEDFKHGKIDVLSNVDILTEGFDEPSVENICIVRPTTSLGLYAQIVGRGLRLSPATGKTSCNVIDFTGDTKKSKLANLFDLFELEVGDKEKNLMTDFSISSVMIDDEAKLEVTYGQESNKIFTKKPEYNISEYMLNISMDNEDMKLIALKAFSSIFMKTSTDEHGLGKLEYIDINREGDDRIIESINGVPHDYVSQKLYSEWIKNVSTTVDNNEKISKGFLSFLSKKYKDTLKHIKFKDASGNASTFLKEVKTKFQGMALKSFFNELHNEKDMQSIGHVDRFMNLDYVRKCKDIPEFLQYVEKYHGNLKYVKTKPDAIIMDSIRRYYYAHAKGDFKSKKVKLRITDRYFKLSFKGQKHKSKNVKIHIKNLKEEYGLLELFKLYLKAGKIEIINIKQNDKTLEDMFQKIGQVKFYRSELKELDKKTSVNYQEPIVKREIYKKHKTINKNDYSFNKN